MTPPAPASRPAVSVVAVHYRTPGLLDPALRAVAQQLEAVGVGFELLVVDNSADAPELELAATRVLRPAGNLGYAGGLAAGVEASRGEVLVAMNPDVVVLPGCLGALLEALAAGAGAAGPRFFWDAGRRLLLPPAEERSLASELLRALAARAAVLGPLARRRWRRHARRHWMASQPLASFALSGALLAIRRAAWDAVGPFDAGYPLYFEETDWLERARRRGVRASYVPGAEAVHRFDQSGRLEHRREEWYARSCRRFRERRYGRLAARLLERVEATPSAAGAPPARLPPARVAEPVWVEVSPRAQGFPAAAEPGVAAIGSWQLPAEIRAHHPDLGLYLTWSDRRGRELGRHALGGADRVALRLDETRGPI
ncbi:MAG TPA: glycosyltransferase [Thermoanaerobaculia bacterium]|nr:glycosyltransferase [Thermoanaerobaculia bacterium]